jgi:hypothetical protein
MKTLIALALSAAALCGCAVSGDYAGAPLPTRAPAEPQPKLMSMGQWKAAADAMAAQTAAELAASGQSGPFCVQAFARSEFARSYARFYAVALARDGVALVSAPPRACERRIVLSFRADVFGSERAVLAADPFGGPGALSPGREPYAEASVSALASEGPRVINAQSAVYYFAEEDEPLYAADKPALPPLPPAPEPGRVFPVRPE